MSDEKTDRNKRVQARYDELRAEGRHGHYETMFRVVREEVERERERCAKVCEARMEEAERESGPEAAGHLEFVASEIRKG